MSTTSGIDPRRGFDRAVAHARTLKGRVQRARLPWRRPGRNAG